MITSLPLKTVLLNIICTLYWVMYTSHSSSTLLTSMTWRRCPNCWDTCVWIDYCLRTVRCLMESCRPAPTLYLVETSGRLLSRRCRWLRTTTCSQRVSTKRCTPPRLPGCRWWDGRSEQKHFVKNTYTADIAVSLAGNLTTNLQTLSCRFQSIIGFTPPT